ncbi:5351_t:CDS:2 [Scutellospora calospora]|uniref:5351_t:CDS:1 n=1 Tax=Scutellospora calospora TaxID=85575 RepID=A0ACA9LZH1_9GLOM|nr:5351_t:CDS:2 [Scutellospora calospora]
MLKHNIWITLLTTLLIAIISIMRSIEALPLKLRSSTLPPSVATAPPVTPLSGMNAPPPTTVNPKFGVSPKNPQYQQPPSEKSNPIATNTNLPVNSVPLPATPTEEVNTAPGHIARSAEIPTNNLHNQNFVPFMYKRANNAYRIPYNIHKRSFIPNFGMMYHNNPLYRRNSGPLIPILGGEEAELLCGIVAQWRRKLLPITSVTSSFLIKKLCDVGAHHSAFNMLADRSKYALKPNIDMFRLIMLAYENELVESTQNIENTNKSIESTQNIENYNKDVESTQNIENTNKDIESTQNIENDNKSVAELVLDDLYRTFGLMPYYDVPQFDVHLYTIMLSASMKIGSWKLCDEVGRELMDHLNNLYEDDKGMFEEYDDEIRISRLKSCLNGLKILEEWFREGKIITEKWFGENEKSTFGDKLKVLQERWKNEIEKLRKKGASM